MASFERSIEINVPVRTAYNQWTQFEEFQQIMDGVEEVRQLDDTRLHWKASIAGKEEEWNATITDQVPDQHVAWRSTSGSENAGVIHFQPLGPEPDQGDSGHRLRPGGDRRERRRKARLCQSTRRGRSGAVQVLHRRARRGNRSLARRDPRRRGRNQLLVANTYDDPALTGKPASTRPVWHGGEAGHAPLRARRAADLENQSDEQLSPPAHRLAHTGWPPGDRGSGDDRSRRSHSTLRAAARRAGRRRSSPASSRG